MKYLWSTISDLLTLIILLILYPFRSSKLDLPKAGMDILCVHGYLHNGTGWGYFRRKLQASGFGPVNTVYYPTLTQDIPTNCLKIKARIEQIKRETGRDVRILIGHSQGGLESLEYALEYAPNDIPIYIITMGSPLHGTKAAHYAVGPSARQMKINSAYLKSLHERLAKASHIHLLALYSDADMIIQPTNSAAIPELPYAQSERIEALGHLAFLFSNRALNKTIAFLRSFELG
jgi:triacylglycerol lipase